MLFPVVARAAAARRAVVALPRLSAARAISTSKADEMLESQIKEGWADPCATDSEADVKADYSTTPKTTAELQKETTEELSRRDKIHKEWHKAGQPEASASDAARKK